MTEDELKLFGDVSGKKMLDIGCGSDNTIVMADAETEDIFIAEYDLEKLRDYRSHEMMGNTFRKIKAYSELISNDIKEPFIR